MANQNTTDSVKIKNPKGAGRKPGPGRKPSDDPKQLVGLWIKTSDIERLGGKEKVRELCLQMIQKKP